MQTVNQENRHKVEELSQLSSDLQNLLAATDIATLSLTATCGSFNYAPRVAELRQCASDRSGTSNFRLTHRLGYGQLRADAEAVLSRLVPVERDSGRQRALVFNTRTAISQRGGSYRNYHHVYRDHHAENRGTRTPQQRRTAIGGTRGDEHPAWSCISPSRESGIAHGSPGHPRFFHRDYKRADGIRPPVLILLPGNCKLQHSEASRGISSINSVSFPHPSLRPLLKPYNKGGAW